MEKCHICCESEETVGRLNLISEADRNLLKERFTWMQNWTQICITCIEQCKTQPTPQSSDDEDNEDEDNEPPPLIYYEPPMIYDEHNSRTVDEHAEAEYIDPTAMIQELDNMHDRIHAITDMLPLPLQLILLPPAADLVQDHPMTLEESSARIRRHILNRLLSIIERRARTIQRPPRIIRRTMRTSQAPIYENIQDAERSIQHPPHITRRRMRTSQTPIDDNIQDETYAGYVTDSEQS